MIFIKNNKVTFNKNKFRLKDQSYVKKGIFTVIDSTFSLNGSLLVILSDGSFHRNPNYLLKVNI